MTRSFARSLAGRALGSLLGLVTLLAIPVRAADEHADPHDEGPSAPVDLGAYVPGAQALEGRIIAPCCFNQTIDVHGSPLAMALRKEIRVRLRAGETSEAIERSFVAQYGPRVLTEPSGGPLRVVGMILSISVLLAGVVGAFQLRRWRRASKASQELVAPDAARESLDARLDSELADLGRD